mmetsp:Transcript_45149/g.125227  ORF Transcript_45149/g.125227 Transcript_45149/m.125227 type:complete len:426 (-) Transcript_45149:315-1592(-)
MAAPRSVEVHEHVDRLVLNRGRKRRADEHPDWAGKVLGRGLRLAFEPRLQLAPFVIVDELDHPRHVQALGREAKLVGRLVRSIVLSLRRQKRHHGKLASVDAHKFHEAAIGQVRRTREAHRNAAADRLRGLPHSLLQAWLLLGDEEQYRQRPLAPREDLVCGVRCQRSDHRHTPRLDPPVEAVAVLKLSVIDGEALVVRHEHHDRWHGYEVLLLVGVPHRLVAALQRQVLLPTHGLVQSLHGEALSLNGCLELVRPISVLRVPGLIPASHHLTRQVNALLVFLALANGHGLANQGGVPGDVLGDFRRDLRAPGFREHDVLEMARRLDEGDIAVVAIREKADNVQVVVVQEMLRVFDVLQQVVPVDVEVDPLHNLLPTPALLRIVLEDLAVDEELHHRECVDAILLPDGSVSVRVDLGQLNRRIVD